MLLRMGRIGTVVGRSDVNETVYMSQLDGHMRLNWETGKAVLSAVTGVCCFGSDHQFASPQYNFVRVMDEAAYAQESIHELLVRL